MKTATRSGSAVILILSVVLALMVTMIVMLFKKEEVDPKQKGPRRLSSRARSAAKDDGSTNNVYTVSIPKGDNVTLHVRVENGGNCYGRVNIKKK